MKNDFCLVRLGKWSHSIDRFRILTQLFREEKMEMKESKLDRRKGKSSSQERTVNRSPNPGSLAIPANHRRESSLATRKEPSVLFQP